METELPCTLIDHVTVSNIEREHDSLNRLFILYYNTFFLLLRRYLSFL